MSLKTKEIPINLEKQAEAVITQSGYSKNEICKKTSFDASTLTKKLNDNYPFRLTLEEYNAINQAIGEIRAEKRIHARILDYMREVQAGKQADLQEMETLLNGFDEKEDSPTVDTTL